jgi:hypothetical protein
LLFPGDAQWGTWEAIMGNAETSALVSGTAMYKVGHHGSHNATPKHFVEDLLVATAGSAKRRRPTSMVSVAPTNYGGGWQDIPLDALVTALKARGPVIESDLDTPTGTHFTSVSFNAKVHVPAAISMNTMEARP